MRRSPGTAAPRVAFGGVALVTLVAWTFGCRDGGVPLTSVQPSFPARPPVPTSYDTIPRLLVSDPVPLGSANAGGPVRGATSGSAAYVSLPTGSVPAGLMAIIRSAATGVSDTITMVDGGFDPVVLAASEGDTLVTEIRRDGARTLTSVVLVPIKRPPVIVRTNPPLRKRDVPLNSVIVIVFSEPIDSATLSTQSLQLLRDSIPTAGAVGFADASRLRAVFRPAGPLAGLTDYQIVVTTSIRDVNGLALESTVRVPFTTVTAPGAMATSVAAGGSHSCALRSDGRASCWGANDHGQLGDGTTNERTLPVLVTGGISFAALAAGGSHTCGLTAGGTAYCWGLNDDGQLGDGSITSRTSPTPVTGNLAFTALSAGGRHTCGLSTAGSVFCWGNNHRGQLGNGSTASSPVPVAAGPALIFNDVSAGGEHTCGTTPSAELDVYLSYCWGSNAYGQVGDGAMADALSPHLITGMYGSMLRAGQGHTCVFDFWNVGVDYCWGLNDRGQLDDGTTTNRPIPGRIEQVPCGPPGGVCPFAAVTMGESHTCAQAGGYLYPTYSWYCWGANGHGQLGDGTTTDRMGWVPVGWIPDRFVPDGVRAGARHTCGVTTVGAVYCWGENANGQLGNGTTTDSSLPVAVTGIP